MTSRLVFLDDPEDFLAAAGRHLAADPVASTVVATMATRASTDRADGLTLPPDDWWLVVRDGAGTVVGAGMRTAPFALRPAYLLPMPDDAARLLAHAMAERGEALRAVNGALPTAQICAHEIASLAGASVRVARSSRLFAVQDLIEPRPVDGRLRAATAADVEIAVRWFEAFGPDADEEAGRPPGAIPHETVGPQEMRRRIAAGRLWFWVDAHDEPMSLVAANSASLGVARIGPVFTPRHVRRRGYASAAVAEVSQRLLAAGARPCLFTDQANPTSNHVYEALGYRQVVDTADLVVR